MDTNILRHEVQDYIIANRHKDTATLLLKRGEVAGVSLKLIAQQIISRNKLEKKLPHWTATSGIYYPPILSAEQCSSAQTAEYKATLLKKTRVVDLTGGMGADTAAFAQQCPQVIYVEKDEELCAIARHNFKALRLKNIEVRNITAEDFISATAPIADHTFYADPARRDVHKKKVFLLSDCQPDIAELLPLLLQKGSRVLIKLSPLLDIRQALRELSGISQIHVLAVKNECKELLFVADREYEGSVEVFAVNFVKAGKEIFRFILDDEPESRVEYGLPEKYIYEPGAAILKAGAFRSVAEKFRMKKLHQHSHLYTSSVLVTDFPGKTFILEAILPFKEKLIKKALPGGQANVSTRNFPLSPPRLQARLHVKPGGEDFLMGTTLCDGRKVVLLLK